MKLPLTPRVMWVLMSLTAINDLHPLLDRLEISENEINVPENFIAVISDMEKFYEIIMEVQAFSSENRHCQIGQDF